MLRRNAVQLCLLAALSGAPAIAGGFWLTVRSPQTLGVKDSVLAVEISGCHDPGKATISATAEGLVDGKRQSIPLNVTATGKPGSYTIKKQWPSTGAWVLAFTSKVDGLAATALVELERDGTFHAEAASMPANPGRGVHLFQRDLTAADINSALSNVASTVRTARRD
jgi:hypothetical protein